MPPPSKGSSTDEGDYPMAGETLGLWRLVRGIGRGGMGEVYEAEYDYLHLLTLRYPSESRDVIRAELAALARGEQARLAGEMLGTPLPPEARFAIKICNARSGTAGHKRFLQEAEVAQRLGDHPYIVTVHAVNDGGGVSGLAGKFALERGRYKDIAFMVMDLAVRDYDHTKLSTPEAVHIVRCIATALDHAHRHGIIHRDLKPENILGAVHYPLLTDFGIAKELDQSHGLTRTGQIIGTLDYMSPEQATDAKRVDHRSDIYSLGVVLYEMATQGCLPYFHKMDRESCLAAIRAERVEPKWPREYVRAFPLALERIILKALSHRMEDRYQAMSEFINDLDRFSRGDWVPFFGRVSLHRFARYHLRRHPRTIWGSAAALALALLLPLVLALPRWLDANRRDLDRQLDEFELVVKDIESGEKSQPSKDESRKIEDLLEKFGFFGTERYGAQQQRYQQLDERLLANRKLEARFAGRTRDGSRPLTGPECARAMEQLQLAAHVETPLWTLRDHEGLYLQEGIHLSLGPYGAGEVYCFLQLKTSDGFQLRMREAKDPEHHRVVWRVQDGTAQLLARDDERPLVILHQEILPDARNHQISIAIELTNERVRSWWPEEQDFARPGLSAGAQAMVELDLPRDSVLMALEIWPRGPR